MQGWCEGFWMGLVHNLSCMYIHLLQNQFPYLTHTPTCSVTKERLTSLPLAATTSLNLDLVCNYSLIDIH